MKDVSSRPEIASKVEMDKYDRVFVGFPIWWYREPSIIDTFFDSYDFKDKEVFLFATSGGSGILGAANHIEKLKSDIKIIDSKIFRSRVSEEDIRKWVSTLK